MPARRPSSGFQWQGYCTICWHRYRTITEIATCIQPAKAGPEGARCGGRVVMTRLAEPAIRIKQTATVRPAVEHRAGTHLRPAGITPVMARGKQHGVIDRLQGIYQTGGEAESFILQARGLVTMAAEAWEKIDTSVRWLEFIDHTRNQCYRLATTIARGREVRYDAGIGDRVGWPVAWFDVLDRDEIVVRAGTPPEAEE